MPTPTKSPATREEQAHLEIGRTAVSPSVARTLVGGFLTLCCAIPLFELWHVARGDEAARAPWVRLQQMPTEIEGRTAAGDGPWRRLVNGNRAVLEGLHEFEDALEDEARLGQLLRPRAQLLLSDALGVGNEQAYLGREGWLFYRRDVDSVTSRGFLEPEVLERRRASGDEWTRPPQPDPREAILAFHRALAAQGITLIVLPVPVKPSVQPGELARRVDAIDAAPTNPDYSPLLQQLRDAGVEVIDPTALLYEAASTGATQYLQSDTHWRPEAMEAVAQMVADTVRRIGLPPAEDPGYQARPADVTARGDIFAMLDLPPGQELIPEETATIRRITTSGGGPWRSSQEADVLLLGDSFSNIYSLESMGWGTSAGFAEQLSYALRRPVDRIVQNDAGAYATRELLHRAGPDRLKGKRVVIWQFATRELVLGDWRIY